MTRITLPSKITPIINDFLDRLKGIYGDDILSVILYGSSASGEFAGRHSDINMLIVLKGHGSGKLLEVRRVLKGRRFNAIDPIFFSEDFLKNSADVFPVEFLDMKENHLLLYGRDILLGLEIDAKNLRFQCEHELKSKIVAMRRFLIRNRDKAALGQALFNYLTSGIHILRNLIRLKGAIRSYRKEDVLRQASVEFGIDTAVPSRILEAKNKNARLACGEAESLFTGLISFFENIADKAESL